MRERTVLYASVTFLSIPFSSSSLGRAAPFHFFFSSSDFTWQACFVDCHRYFCVWRVTKQLAACDDEECILFQHHEGACHDGIGRPWTNLSNNKEGRIGLHYTLEKKLGAIDNISALRNLLSRIGTFFYESVGAFRGSSSVQRFLTD